METGISSKRGTSRGGAAPEDMRSCLAWPKWGSGGMRWLGQRQKVMVSHGKAWKVYLLFNCVCACKLCLIPTCLVSACRSVLARLSRSSAASAAARAAALRGPRLRRPDLVIFKRSSASFLNARNEKLYTCCDCSNSSRGLILLELVRMLLEATSRKNYKNAIALAVSFM